MWRIPIQPDGSAGQAVVMAELFHTVPDGVAFDTEGRCYVAHYTPDRIDRILPDGTVETVVEDWEAIHLNAPTNIAFCGPNLEFVAAACVGEEFLAIADLGVRGQPAPPAPGSVGASGAVAVEQRCRLGGRVGGDLVDGIHDLPA